METGDSPATIDMKSDLRVIYRTEASMHSPALVKSPSAQHSMIMTARLSVIHSSFESTRRSIITDAIKATRLLGGGRSQVWRALGQFGVHSRTHPCANHGVRYVDGASMQDHVAAFAGTQWRCSLWLRR
jgi:hypothetical protein